VILQIKDLGGCRAKIIGHLQSLTAGSPNLNYSSGVPRYCFVADEIYVKRLSTPDDLLTTVAVMFSAPPRIPHPSPPVKNHLIEHKSWSFCSFNPGSANGIHNAAEWLFDYASRYSENTPVILTDFDEHRPLFPSVEFPLSQIIRGEINPDTLRSYRHHASLVGTQATFIDNYFEYVMEMNMEGEKITAGTGAIIVNRSRVQNAFNKVTHDYDESTANALRKIEEEINNSGNKDAAENFNSFNEELEKPQSRKSVLKSLWQGTVAALPKLLEFADDVAKISVLFN
jgi:hypothetical protein